MCICMYVYIYIYIICMYVVLGSETLQHPLGVSLLSRHVVGCVTPLLPQCAMCKTRAREFKDVVFEDVVFDNNSFVTIYCGKLH